MMQFNKLPSKDGYREIEVEGKREYAPTAETVKMQLDKEENAFITTQLESTQAMLDSILMGDITL